MEVGYLRFYLASENPHIHSLCREVLTEVLGQTWTLHCAAPTAPLSEADLYIWDVEPGRDIPAEIADRDKGKHFFFVDRSHLPIFLQALSFQDANILLKPVTKATLMAFLTNACEQMTTAHKRTVESLRSDRDEILQCLLQTNLKLQEYDQDRTNFLARAIHDFRAPLTAINGYCGLLLTEDGGNLTDEQREVIERMHRSAKKLSRMASAMFQLSIAPRAEMILDIQAGEIGDCIDHAVHEIMPAAQEKRLTISVDMIPPADPLSYDRAKIEQVLVNLLDNACKFAPRAGAIEIKGYPYHWDHRFGGESALETLGTRTRKDETPNSYRLDIRDSGPGIPSTRLTKIFEEYTSYGGGGDRSGGGLGLAICRMILNQHKGRIWAESGKDGATFSFVLPFHHTAVRSEEPFARAMNARAF